MQRSPLTAGTAGSHEQSPPDVQLQEIRCRNDLWTTQWRQPKGFNASFVSEVHGNVISRTSTSTSRGTRSSSTNPPAESRSMPARIMLEASKWAGMPIGRACFRHERHTLSHRIAPLTDRHRAALDADFAINVRDQCRGSPVPAPSRWNRAGRRAQHSNAMQCQGSVFRPVPAADILQFQKHIAPDGCAALDVRGTFRAPSDDMLDHRVDR